MLMTILPIAASADTVLSLTSIGTSQYSTSYVEAVFDNDSDYVKSVAQAGVKVNDNTLTYDSSISSYYMYSGINDNKVGAFGKTIVFNTKQLSEGENTVTFTNPDGEDISVHLKMSKTGGSNWWESATYTVEVIDNDSESGGEGGNEGGNENEGGGDDPDPNEPETPSTSGYTDGTYEATEHNSQSYDEDITVTLVVTNGVISSFTVTPQYSGGNYYYGPKDTEHNFQSVVGKEPTAETINSVVFDSSVGTGRNTQYFFNTVKAAALAAVAKVIYTAPEEPDPDPDPDPDPNPNPTPTEPEAPEHVKSISGVGDNYVISLNVTGRDIAGRSSSSGQETISADGTNLVMVVDISASIIGKEEALNNAIKTLVNSLPDSSQTVS